MPLDLDKYILSPTFTETAYLKQLQKLLPSGPIWEFAIGTGLVVSAILRDFPTGTGNTQLQDEPTGTSGNIIQDTINTPSAGELIAGSLFGRLLSCFAVELFRLELYVFKLLNEAVPGLSVELLPDWERVLGLPDKCSLLSDFDTQEEQQEIAHTKYFGEYQTVTKDYLIEYAAVLGFTISIEELQLETNSFIMGVAIMGANELGGQGSFAVLEITVQPGGTGSLEQMQCIFNRLKPAHTVIQWVIL